jgi:sec-independent protein translocase protein TatB
MFDITSSKLLILGIVALLVIGPKDLPALLRTIGKYMGIIKRHAADFRAQFDDAMRESELADLKKDVEKMGAEAEATVRAAELSVDKELSSAQQDVDQLMGAEAKPADDLPTAPVAHDANDLPMATTAEAAPETPPPALNGASHPHEAGTPAKAETVAAEEPGGTAVKTGA